MSASLLVGILGMLLGGGGVATALIARATALKVEAAKNVAVSNSQRLEARRFELELNDRLRAEIDRKDLELKDKDKRYEELERDYHQRGTLLLELQEKLRGQG